VELLVLMALFSCAGARPPEVGRGGPLAPCPSSPNCVSSDAHDEAHAIAPFALAAPADDAWAVVQAVVAEQPRTTVLTRQPRYLHAECRSALFGFVDDLELALRPEEGLIAVRSASRLGRSDLGVNRRRVEQLRAQLRARGVVRR
jgi:uncharacterized protein (DUF1499 family)